MKQCKVGVVQATAAAFDLEGTIGIVDKWLKAAKADECDLVLFPESFIPCYPRGFSFDATIGNRSSESRSLWYHFYKNALEIGSPEFKKLSGLVATQRLRVVIGVTERTKIGGSLYCSMLYFDKTGKLQGVHRKIKPTGLERYIWAEGNGEDLVSFSSDIGVIGGLICWENYMPLARQSMYSAGVQIYLAPTADMRDSWQATLQHIALEGRCFVLAANQYVPADSVPASLRDVVKDAEFECRGGSAIYSPYGTLLAGPVYGREELLTATLDFDELHKSKLDFDVIGHYARQDIFRFHTNGQPNSGNL